MRRGSFFFPGALVDRGAHWIILAGARRDRFSTFQMKDSNNDYLL
jgi:hypothetical protein